MNRWVRNLTSSVGLKFLMAATGVLLFGFVLAHLAGNLQVFGGPDLINAYAVKLKALGPGLWVARLGLLGVITVHIGCALTLTLRNRAARPKRYAMQQPIASTEASRTMLASGAVILLFVVYHLMHFTIGVVIRPDLYELVDDQGRHDVYSMMVAGFQQLPIALFYALAMVGLGMHLSHGIGSILQSAGWLRPRYRPAVILGGRALAWLIVLGNVGIVAAAFFGVLELPQWYPSTGGQ